MALGTLADVLGNDAEAHLHRGESSGEKSGTNPCAPLRGALKKNAQPVSRKRARDLLVELNLGQGCGSAFAHR